MNRNRGLFGICLIISLILPVVGCAKKIPIVPVSGKVTVGGNPAPDCTILFTTITGTGGESIGARAVTDADGNYTLMTSEDNPRKGAGAGNNRVILKWIDKDYPFNYGDPSKTPPPKRKAAPYHLPPKAASGELTFTVPAGGTTEANFDF